LGVTRCSCSHRRLAELAQQRRQLVEATVYVTMMSKGPWLSRRSFQTRSRTIVAASIPQRVQRDDAWKPSRRSPSSIGAIGQVGVGLPAARSLGRDETRCARDRSRRDIEDDCDAKYVVLLRQVDKDASRFGLHVRGVDHVRRLSRVVCPRRNRARRMRPGSPPGCLVVAYEAAKKSDDKTSVAEVIGREGRLSRAAHTNEQDE